MQRQLSNYQYQEYQPARRYGAQYEPGGYAAVAQQRSNMTQREDALKFEQGRIRALQEERLHIQKKTFTKWMNSFLQKARMEVDDLFVDLADGRRLLRLLEIISGERLARPNSGRMRVHKIENVNKSLAFLHTKVRLESIGAEDIVDGNPRLILGLIWTIILRFQIQEIEIDVDEENESSEKKSAKDALLLWCQRKTNGYHGINIHNFTDSWRSGLGFNALIHAHRPDLFRWTEMPKKTHIETLNHAFDVAQDHLGIPRLLDAEDVDTNRPDEKSVMTYVASYYHTFARMKNEMKSGRRIANIIGQLMEVDSRKEEYGQLMAALLEWIRLKIEELNDRDLPNSLDGIQRLLLAFKQYRTIEKPPKYKERSEIEALYFSISTTQRSLVRETWSPADGQLPQDLQRAWQRLEQAEHAREVALRTELLRQQKLEQLNYKFNTKSVLRKGYLKEMIQVLSDPRYGSNLAQVDATVKKHEAISADILARTERFDDLSAMANELVREGYHGAEAVTRTEQAVLGSWRELLALLAGHRDSLQRLSQLMALVREADTTLATVEEMDSQFQSEETGPHLLAVEQLLQAHALRELQLGALGETIRRLARQGAQVQGPAQPKQQLDQKLKQLEEAYDSLVAAAKDRKARLEDARNLYQFLEDHDEEEGWLTDRQRICRAGISAKDLRAVLALQQKHTALLHEMRAREHVSNRVPNKGRSLIEAKHPRSAEVEKRLASLAKNWELLRELAAAREKQLLEAAEAYQFYADANEAESWINEKRPVAGSTDVGVDEPGAQALLARQRALAGELAAYAPELDALRAQARKLEEAGISCLQLPAEPEPTPAPEEEEWVNETRLVPTEVWEEEPVERLEHRTVTEERSVPQVKALYAFSGQGTSMAKGEVMFLINKTNPDWWSVRKADRTDGFVPANYVREIEPRIVPVQVRRPEKVRTVQRVKKTVLVKQVVPVRRSLAVGRRASRPQLAAQLAALRQRDPGGEGVQDRMKRVNDGYEELLKLSAARRAQLEDAIRLYGFYRECDDFDKWIKDKEKLLRADESSDSVETAKRKYEKFVTDLSASSRRLEAVDRAADALAEAQRARADTVRARQAALHAAWDRLAWLKAQKEKSLEGASSVELFGRTCDEARDWLSEKSSQLDGSALPGADLRTVQALQRRHAALERELEPLREKVHRVNLLADSVKSSYPSEQANVDARQREIQEMWRRCQELAAERRARLENAVGHQIFGTSSTALQDWSRKVREQIAAEAKPTDVATAEALAKEHNELKDDIKAHADEYKEVIELGEKLVANNPALADVAERIKILKEEQKAVEKEWQEKEAYLKQCVQLQTFNREADQIDATTGSHQAFLEYRQQASSVDEAEALLKRHEELEATLAAQDERLRAFANTADALVALPHYAADHITHRKTHTLARRDAVRSAAAERRRSLQAALAYQQFAAAADDLGEWIQDKMRTATDQNYRDLTNLERKLQKHEAYERELRANEKQLRNVDSIGQSLIQSDPAHATEVEQRLETLHEAWDELVAASRDKGARLRQAAAQRAHRRAAEDARARLAHLQRELRSQETGADLRSCKRLVAQHQALEMELTQWESKAVSLAATGEDMVAEGHFDADAVARDSHQLLAASAALAEPARARRAALEEGLRYHKFATSVGSELTWIAERAPAASSETLPTELHGAQHAHKKHAKLREEIAGRRAVVDRVLSAGAALVDEGHAEKEKIEDLCKQLETAYESLSASAEARATKLDGALRAQQFLQDALEVDTWLADKAAALASTDYGRDRDHAMQLLTRHKATELELDTYAGIVSEMGHAAAALATGPLGDEPQKRHALLAANLRQLQRAAAQRQKALVESMCRHEYLVESAELEQWIQEQMATASSEDYGQDYEHLLVLRSNFEELRDRVETGSERFNQCEELARKLVASESPYIADIEKRQEALGESWQRLVEQIASRSQRLSAAGEIHRFHRDVAEALSRIADKRAALDGPDSGRDLNAVLALLRKHETLENDLIALDCQLNILMEDAERLQALYPGGNASHIARQQKALAESWESLKDAAAERRDRLHAACDLHRFLTQVRDLTSWSTDLRATMGAEARVRDASAAQALRAEHGELKAEIEAREDSFRAALDLGSAMVQTGHRSATEVEERRNALLAERSRLHAAWHARQVALDQLSDLHFFLRDAKQMHNLCVAQEAALGKEISPTSSVEEVDAQLKKHEAFEKLLNTQVEKLTALNSVGAKLLQQNHVESDRIAAELEQVNKRRKKVHEMSTAYKEKLINALLRAQFVRDAAEARGWIAGKMKKLEADHGQAEVTSLEQKIAKLQKHQAFRAELAANAGRVADVAATAERLAARSPADAEELRPVLKELEKQWALLLERTEEKGRGLEEAQDMLEFNNHLDKIEAWIRDKEMMVQAHDTGRDYEHCSALLRKLDDVDSDMRVDDKHIKTISSLADKLLQQGQQGEQVAKRRDAFLKKWRALSGALQAYRDDLGAALEIHLYNRDVADTAERVAEKAAALGSADAGRDLAAVEELRRRHDALVTEATAIGDKIKQHESEAARLVKKYPEHAEHINARLSELKASWRQLLDLAKKREKLLENANIVHKFDAHLKELEVWVAETVKRMNVTEPPSSVPEAEALLELHQERKAEIDGRQKSVASLRAEAEKQLAPLQAEDASIDLPAKMQRLERLAETLDGAWEERRLYLTQAHQLQLLKEQARQTEDWLAEKEAFLNNDDLGESLVAVDTLMRKHNDFEKLLNSQLGRVEELEKFAAVLLKGDHYDKQYIQQRIASITARRDKLKESCAHRSKMLSESRQLQQFLRNLYHEQEWLVLKAQVANDQNYRDLSNLQSKIQKHAAFESELLANKGRIDDVVNDGEELIESSHYAAAEIAQHVERLEAEWSALHTAARTRRERLAAAYQARVFLRGLDDFNAWIDDVEAQLLSEDHGKDLASVAALLKRHGRLEAGMSSRAETAAQLAETARHLADADHFMADELLAQAERVVTRYRQLQEPMQIRRDNLEDALLLQRWERDADEELQWLAERAPAAAADDTGDTLAQAQSLCKKHQGLEAELMSREPVVNSLASRATQLIRRGHFASARLEERAAELQEQLQTLNDLAALRRLRLQDAVEMHQFNAEASEAEAWLAERRPPLVSSDVGRDEDSVQALQRRLEVQQRELATFDASLARLEKLASALGERASVDMASVQARLDGVKKSYEDLKLLSAKRQQRLQQSLKYFKFVHECEEVQEWVGDQMTLAASEEYGQDVEHVETLQQAFDNFQASLCANEGRVESIAEAGKVLIEERTPEAELVNQKVEETRGLWEDLKELASARQEALAGARQVHLFVRTADETVAWIAEKDSALSSELSFGGHHDLHAIQALVRKHEALEADLEAIRQQVEQLSTEAERLGSTFPDARSHVSGKLEEVAAALAVLQERAASSREQLQKAEQLQAYFDNYRELMAWTNEALARVTAPDLAHDVASAELLMARHADIRVELDARQDDFNKFYNDGETLVSEGHFLSSEISERVAALRGRQQLLGETWKRRAVLYEQHHDALVFRRDADALDTWISARVPQLRDGKLGDNITHVEELIKKHEDFEKTIEAQNDRFKALQRITLVEKAFKTQLDEEAAARRRAAERAEADRLELRKRVEMQRITEERRREDPPTPQHVERQQIAEPKKPVVTSPQVAELQQSESPALQKANSVAHMFGEHLHKMDPSVKRAESMNVGVKTPKRTPSFTTRRRTQSFRKHQRGDTADLPPVEIEGYLERKQEAGCGGKRATVRSWRQYYSVLCGQLLCFFRDELDFASAKAAAPPVAILNARCSPAGDYTKRAHVFRLACADGAEYLFGCSSRAAMLDWVAKIAFHAALAPQLQLTPYGTEAGAESPTAEVRRKLQSNASSSSSAGSSPEPERRAPRTQTEILTEHRRSLPPKPATAVTSQSALQSSALPSLPPRQPVNAPPSHYDNDVMYRNSEPPSWGRTRHSNGRDQNTDFIQSQQQTAAHDYQQQRHYHAAPPLPESGPPTAPPPVKLTGANNNLPDKSGQVSALVSSWQQRQYQQSMPSHRELPSSNRSSISSNSIVMGGSNNNNNNNGSSTASWQHQHHYGGQQQSSESSHFYMASDFAYNSSASNNNSTGSRPASVAGGSPVVSDRPMSESSGESELSVASTREKRDKKGMFGGLFRKKRPQSHM